MVIGEDLLISLSSSIAGGIAHDPWADNAVNAFVLGYDTARNNDTLKPSGALVIQPLSAELTGEMNMDKNSWEYKLWLTTTMGLAIGILGLSLSILVVSSQDLSQSLPLFLVSLALGLIMVLIVSLFEYVHLRAKYKKRMRHGYSLEMFDPLTAWLLKAFLKLRGKE